jgi:hypothetical protein
MPVTELPLLEIFLACVHFETERDIIEVKGDVGGKREKGERRRENRDIYDKI